MSADRENATQSGAENSGGELDLNNVIGKLLANPELVNMVANAVGKPSPLANTQKKNEEEKEGEALPKDKSAGELALAIAPVLSGLGSKHESAEAERRAKLLCSLKPYLCQGRCEAIDYIIKLGRITELIKNMS